MRLVLYDIPDKDALCAALRSHERRAGQHGLFATPVLIGPDMLPELPPAVSEPAVPVPVWLWDGDAGSLRATATEVLRRLVFPITHSPGSFCLSFPFPALALAAQPLSMAAAASLDVEDIGRLLDGAPTASPTGRGPSAALSACPRPAVQRDLDEPQRRAVGHRGGALRVLAPAGSGKTKTMINRVASLVADGTPAGSIIVIAFNTKAAEQLEQRLGRLGVPTTRRVQDDSGVHCATFNAFGYRYQREIMQAAPQVSDDAAERAHLMRASVWAALTEGAGAYANGSRSGSRPPQRGREAAALDDLVWRALDGLAQMHAALSDPASIDLPLPALFADCRGSRLPFDEVERRFSDAQRHHSVQAFDDQISQAVLDLLAHPARRHALQDRYRHVLVDEFQDLNSAQLALVDIISRPHRRLFVVGDDDQLIYGWRFAQVENILGFPQRMPVAPHCETFILTTNYRCSREVVRRADMLISHNARRVDKQIRCRDGAPEGAVVLCSAADWRQRASALAGFLADSHTIHGCAWNDLAVLSRYRAQLQPVAVVLDAAGVPHAPLPGARLFTLPAARLLHSCLTLVAGAGLDQETSSHLAACLHLSEAELRSRAHSLRRWLRAEHPTAHEGLEEVLLDLRLEEACATRPRSLRATARSDAEDDGPAVVLEAARLLSLDHGSLQSYLAAWAGWVDQEQEDAARSTDRGAADGVVLSTIHAAKGREYRSVVIADFAVDLGSLTPAQVEEERRVLYVALTRAAESVLLTVDTHKRAPHQFVGELADPPSRELASRLRHELAHLGTTSAAVPSTGDPESELQAAQLRLRGLELAGRLAEYQWFRPASRLRRAAGIMGLASARR